MTLKNFFVLTRYNRSNLYAAAVLDLAAEIARARAAAAKGRPMNVRSYRYYEFVMAAFVTC